MTLSNNVRRPSGAGSEPAMPIAAVEDDEPAALMVDEHGLVRDCNPAGERLFGYECGELLLQHVSKVLPQLLGRPLLTDGRLDTLLLFHCRIGGWFHALNRDGEPIAVELYVSDLGSRGAHRLRILARPGNGARTRPTTIHPHPHPSTPPPASDGDSA